MRHGGVRWYTKGIVMGYNNTFARRYGGRWWGGVRRSGVRLCSGDARCVGRGQILFGSQCGARGPSLRNRRQPVLGRYSYLLGEFVRLHRSFKPAKLAGGGCYVFCLSVRWYEGVCGCRWTSPTVWCVQNIGLCSVLGPEGVVSLAPRIAEESSFVLLLSSLL